MRVDSFDIDELIRAELDATRPEPTFAMDRIETRAAQLRWKSRTQLAVLAVAAVIAVVVALAATATTGTKQVNVADDRPAADTPVTTVHATTTTMRPTTTTIAVTPSNNSPRQPGRAVIGAGPSTGAAIPSVDTPSTVGQPTPTTVKTVTPTTTPTTPTTVYDPYPPVPQGARRMVITVDDDGVRAPATFKGDKPIQIIFVDNRTVRPDGDAMLYSTDGGRWSWAWDGTKNEVGTWTPSVGPWELNASDRLNVIETFTIQITAG
jgi:hypothetical protein